MAGLADSFYDRLIGIESGGNPSTWNRLPGGGRSRYRGLAQFGPDQERRYGITDQNWMDPTVQRQALTRHVGNLQTGLRRSLGRDPTEGETYLAHQQGPTGARVLLQGGQTPAWQAIRPYYRNDRMAQLAITGNIPRQHAMAGRPIDQITSQDFANLWAGRFPGAAPSQPPPTSAPIGAPQMATGRGLASMLFPAANAAETPRPQAAGFNPGMLAQIMQSLQPQAQPPAQPQQSAGGGMLDWMLPPEQRGAGGAPPNLDWMLPQAQRGPAPPAPMGVPPMAGATQGGDWDFATQSGAQMGQPPTVESASPSIGPQMEALIAANPDSGVQAPARPAPTPPEPTFADRLSGFAGGMDWDKILAGLAIAGAPFGTNPFTAGAQVLQSGRESRRRQDEHERTQRQRKTMDRVWAEAFPGGQPNMQHPLLTGQSPQVAAMIAGLGPEQALPLLARSAMERRQLELKDIGGTPYLFDPRSGAVQQVPGSQPRVPEAVRTKFFEIERAVQNLTPLLQEYERTMARTGAVMLPGRDNDEVNRLRSNIQLQMKNLKELGALVGADFKFIDAMLPDPNVSANPLTWSNAYDAAGRAAGATASIRREMERAYNAAAGQVGRPQQQQQGTRLRYDPATGELTNAN